MENIKEMFMKLALSAHAGTSHTPEIRAQQEWNDFNATFDQLSQGISALQIAEDEKITEISALKETLQRKTFQLLSIRSRCMSTLVTGPARFPVERQRKCNERYDKALSAYLEFTKGYIRRIMRKYGLLQTGIRINDENAAEKTLAQINAIEAKNDRMKAINALYKKYGPGFTTHIELSDTEKKAIEDHFRFSCSKKPYPSYCFANNNSNKARLEKKLQEIAHRETIFKSKGNEEITTGHLRAVFNITENRTQIFFPDKPETNIRETLKRNGFRWSPRNACWQAYLNRCSQEFARSFLTLYGPQQAAKTG